MKIVDDATPPGGFLATWVRSRISIRSFNDATPWYFGPLVAGHCLMDRSMHDYVLDRTAGAAALQEAVDLSALRPRALYDLLVTQQELPRVTKKVPHSILGVGPGWAFVRHMEATEELWEAELELYEPGAGAQSRCFKGFSMVFRP